MSLAPPERTSFSFSFQKHNLEKMNTGAGSTDPAPVEKSQGIVPTGAIIEYLASPRAEVSVNQSYLAPVGTIPWELCFWFRVN